MKALEDRILIRPDKASDEIAGLILQQHEREKPVIGTVLVVGPGRHQYNVKLDITVPVTPEVINRLDQLVDKIRQPVDFGVKVGDRVLYGRYAGTKVKHQGEEVLFIRASDVLSILEDGDEGFEPIR